MAINFIQIHENIQISQSILNHTVFMSEQKKEFGRPKDVFPETEFMEKLRINKLQAIIASCELEVTIQEIDQKPRDQNLPKRRRRRRKSQQFNRKSLLIKHQEILALKIFKLSSQKMEALYHQFVEIINQWQYVDIRLNEPLPQFLFENEADLSYILCSLNRKFGYTIFSASQLFYIELMTLEYLGKMTRKVFNYCRDNMNYILAAINEGLNKIGQKQEQSFKEKKKNQQGLMMDEEKMNDNEQEVDKFFNEGHDSSLVIGKKIKRGRKKRKSLLLQKRAPKKKPIEERDSDESIDIDTEIEYPEGKKLAIILANYISWAYWYIIEK